MMFTASWDKMVRVVDLKENKVTKSFVASKEAIKNELNNLSVKSASPKPISFHRFASPARRVWKAWSSRIVTASLKMDRMVHIISCYAPTKSARREDKDRFFKT